MKTEWAYEAATYEDLWDEAEPTAEELAAIEAGRLDVPEPFLEDDLNYPSDDDCPW